MAEKTFHSLTLPGQDTARIPLTAREFDTNISYAIRDYCTYQGKVYICTAAHASGNAWDSGHFLETNIGAQLNTKAQIPPAQASAPSNPRPGDLWIDTTYNSPVINIDAAPIINSTNVPQSGGTKLALNSLDSRKLEHGIIAGDFSSSVQYKKNDLVFKTETVNGVVVRTLYRCIQEHNAAEWSSQHFVATTLDSEIQILHNNEADTDMLTDPFGAKSTYSIGEYTTYNDDLYRCIRTIDNSSQPSAPFNSADWTQVKLADETKDIVRGIIAENYNAANSYAVGDYVTKDNTFYKCNTTISGGEVWNSNHWDETSVGQENSNFKVILDDVRNYSIQLGENTYGVHGLQRYNGYINADGVWKGANNILYYHVVIPVKSEVTYSFEITEGDPLFYAFLTDYVPVVNNAPVNFVTGYESRINAHDTGSGTIPIGTKYMVVCIYSNKDLTPDHLYINGIDYIEDHRFKDISDEIDEKIDELGELLDYLPQPYNIIWETGQIGSNGTMGTSNAYRRTTNFISTKDAVTLSFSSALNVIYVCEYSSNSNDAFKQRLGFNNITTLTLDYGNFTYPYLKFFVGKDDITKISANYQGPILVDLNNIGSIYKADISKCKWLAMGDSITQGWYSYYDNGSPASKSPTSQGDNFDKMWVAIAAKLLGFNVDNYGVGGSGWVDKGSQASTKPSARQQIDGSVSGYPAPDFTKYNLITLAWGLNDWKGSQDFGSFEDNIQTSDTVIANMRYVIESIIATNPNCKIIGISPLNSRYGNSTAATNWAIGKSINGKTLEEAWNIIKSVYDYYNIETIDMLHYSYLNRNNITTLLIDGIHPSQIGHEMMGRELASKIHYR